MHTIKQCYNNTLSLINQNVLLISNFYGISARENSAEGNSGRKWYFENHKFIQK